MSENLKALILARYLKTYTDLLLAESDDGDSVTISFPFHFISNHRIELTVSQTKAGYVISDSANTMGQLREAGYKLSEELRERLEIIAHSFGLRLVANHFVMDTSLGGLGADLHRFLEAAKTIGDVYLAYKVRLPSEKQLIESVKGVLSRHNYVFKEKADIGGEIEPHKVDFYVPPNGTYGLALAVLATKNSHNAAQVWGFKCEDIKRQPQNKRLRVGIVYDSDNAIWSDDSRRILESRADIAIPGRAVDLELGERLEEHGVLAHR
jgi:hypothetical protein